LIIGIGLNLKDAPDYAISLKNFKISKMEFLDKFTAIFNQYLQKYQQFGFNVIINEWKNNAYKIGQKITLSNSMTGIFKDIDWQGNLLLQDSSGKINKILSEDVFI
jgi:biotin-(acetyl-CoA carboxylase) ligase